MLTFATLLGVAQRHHRHDVLSSWKTRKISPAHYVRKLTASITTWYDYEGFEILYRSCQFEHDRSPSLVQYDDRVLP